MASKLMSPSKPPAWSSPRKPAPSQEVGNDHKLNNPATDVSSTNSLPSRVPLCPIPLPSQVTEAIDNTDISRFKGKSDISTPKCKSKIHSQGLEGIENPELLQFKGKSDASTPRGRSKLYFQVNEGIENPDLPRKSEVLTPRGKSKLHPQSIVDSSGRTPDKQTIPRNRFGWNQSVANLGKEAISYGEVRKDAQTPSKLSRSSSAREFSKEVVATAAVENQPYVNPVQLNINRVGTSNHSTPCSIRNTKALANETETSGLIQCLGTPSRNVSRVLKYSGNNGSGNVNARLGHLTVRSANAMSQALRSHSSDSQHVDVPYFDLEEDPLFWKDHNVQVIIRCRPLNSAEVSSQGYSRCIRQETSHTLTWISQPECRFTFDHVACEKITQDKLFKVAGIPMIDNCMSGYNSCMFAYGQTGSGKTHTMLGDIDELEHRPSDNRGITPRIFEYLFRRIVIEEENRKNEHLKFTCKCSFLEIYNEQITDLLEPSSTNLQMREDIKKGVYVDSLSEVEVKSVQDVIFLLLQGAANRKVAATNMNKESSRSHSVFTCVIESQWEADSMTNIRFGRLNLVDLAGSERQKSSGAEGERLREAANINKSLSTLGLVIMILVDVAQGKQRHVPYRDSKLTFLLQDSLGGNSKTTIIANISPSISCAAETLSTLKFAQRAKFIQNNAIVNEDASGDVLALRLQIQQLKDELHRLSRQSISRMPLSSTTNLCQVANQEIPVGGQAKALETIVAGSLRREQAAESTAKLLTGEIEQLNILVKQREDDAQFNKMMLRFREDKIKRLESTLEGTLSSDSYQSDENQTLKEELQLLRARLDKNPELTGFAIENIRLMDQLQRLQDFYNGGERDLLMEEISALREQVLQLLEGRLQNSASTLLEDKDDKGLSEDRDGVIELKSLLKEKEERIQQEMARADDLNKKLMDAMKNIHVLEEELKKNKNALEDVRGLFERLQVTETKLAAIQDKPISSHGEVINGTHQNDSMNMVELQGKVQDKWPIQELGTVSSCINQKSKLQEKLERTKAALQEALKLNNKLQNEQNWYREVEHQKEQIQTDAEMETIEAITLLQSEIANLLEDQKIAQQREVESDEKVMNLERELEILRTELRLQSEIANCLEDQNLAQQKEVDAERKVRNLEMELETRRSELSALCSENAKISVLYEDAIKAKEQVQFNAERETTEAITLLHSEIVSLLEDQKMAQQREVEAEEKVTNLAKELETLQTELNALSSENAKIKVLYEDAVKAGEGKVKSGAGMETIEVITLLQLEIENLLEAQKTAQQREVEAKEKVVTLERELQMLRTQLSALSSENANVSALYEDAMKAKEEQAQSDAETETIKAIALLQSENVSLLEAKMIAQQREVEAEEKAVKLEIELETLRTELRLQEEITQQQEVQATEKGSNLERIELETLKIELSALSSENAKLNVLYEDAIKAKESEFSKLTDDWETSAINLIECLSEGNLALDAACHEVDGIVNENASYNKYNVFPNTLDAVKDESLVEILQNKLIAAQKLVNETETKVRVLNDVSLAIADVHQREKITMLRDLEAAKLALEKNTLSMEALQNTVDAWEIKALKWENIMVAAFLVIDRFSQLHNEMATEKSRLEDSLATMIAERENEMKCLHLQAMTDSAQLEEKVNVISKNEEAIRSLREHIHHLESCKEESMVKVDAFMLEHDMLVTKLEKAEEQLEYLKLQLEIGEQKNVMLLLEARHAVDDRTITLIENQLLNDIYTCSQNLVIEELLESSHMLSTMEVQNELLNKNFDEKLNQLENERSILLEKLEIEKVNARSLIDDLQAAEKEKYELVVQNEKLQKNSSAKHLHFVQLIEQMKKENFSLQDDVNTLKDANANFSNCLNNLMENWTKDKTLLIFEAEMTRNALQLLEWMLDQNESLHSKKLQLDKELHKTQNIYYEEHKIALENRIAELETVIQGLNEKMQISETKLSKAQLHLNEGEQKSACLSRNLQTLTEELDDCKFGAVVEMHIVRHVLGNELQNIEKYYQQLLLERLNIISTLDTFKSEVVALRTESSLQQILQESQAVEISHFHNKIAGLEMQVKNEEERCSSISLDFQEQLMTVKFLLIFEAAFSKDMLLRMQESFHQENSDFAQILQCKLHEERIENEEKMTGKEHVIAQLQLEVSHLYKTCEELDGKYKDVLIQLQLRDKQIKDLCKQQEESSNDFTLLQQEKQMLEQFIATARLACKTVDGEDVDSPKAYELNAEVQCQRGDMEILKYELQSSCDIVAEMKASHSKSLELLTQREQDLIYVKESQIKLEEENLLLRKQKDSLLIAMHKRENEMSKAQEMFAASREINENIVRIFNDVEIHKNRYTDFHHRAEHLLTSAIVNEGEFKTLEGIVYELNLVLNDIEPLVQFGNKVTQDLENVKDCLHQKEILLNDQLMEMDAMSGLIMDLKRERDILLEEKDRRQAGIKALRFQRDQHEHIGGAIEVTDNVSKNILEVVEGQEMKLIGLHRKIERITKWLYEEVCHDVQVAFTEGCELVLSEVEREIENCREQSDLAWKKFELISDEKGKREKEILQKDELIKQLISEIATFQQEAAKAIQKQEANGIMRPLEEEAHQMQLEINSLEKELEQTRHSNNNNLANMTATIVEQMNNLSLLEKNNIHLKSHVEELTSKINLIEEELEEKMERVELLEVELVELNDVIQQGNALSSEQMQNDLYEVMKERDSLHAELVVLNEQLEMAQETADEQEALAVEARQVAERSKTLAEQKEEDAKFLEQSVKDLESTVNALETQLGMLKIEKRRLMNEGEELEVEALKQQLWNLQHGCEAQFSISEKNQRDLEVKEIKLMEAEQKIGFLEKQCIEKDEQIKRYKNNIVEVMADADRQASEHQHILRSLENMREERSNATSINPKFVDKNISKPRGGSPFKCIGSGLSQQMTHDIEEELFSSQQKIEELEALASSRQKEVFMLNVRLAEAESLTHDVIRDLVGVKLDITNYAALINNHQVQKFAEKSFAQCEETKEKEKELLTLKVKLNEFIEERESWLEEINRRQAEMMTARVAAEKLRQRDQLCGAENEALKIENATQKKKLLELEAEVKKLSGQQNLQQRIHHHAKIKEENNYLRLMNEDLMSKLRRSEMLLNRVNEELARYRVADGKTPHLDLDEEQRLRSKLQEVEEEKIQVAQELITLCTHVLQVTEFQRPTRTVDHVAAGEALKYLRNRLDNTERELADLKLKNKIDLEKRHLIELRSLHSPIPTCQRTGQCASDTPVSSRSLT